MTQPVGPSFVERWAEGDPPPGVLFPEVAFDVDGAITRRAVERWTPLSSDELTGWCDWLRAHDAPAGMIATAGKLGDGRTLCVVTGQQAGFALGPLFVLAKALTAVKLAREVEVATGRACVPLFWVASDDHDVEEAASISWLGDGTPQRHAIATGREASPVHDIPLLAEEAARAAELMAPGDGVFADILVGSTAVTSGQAGTFESSFVRLLLRVTGHLGIVPVAPRLSFLRSRQALLVRREIELRGEPSRELLRMRERLARDFAADTIHRAGNEINFFVEEGTAGSLTRTRMSWREEGICLGGNAPVEAARILELLDREPNRFSPNAAMRPLVQDFALPTVAYIGGPSEVAYHAQIGPLYAMFEVTRPAVFPRPSIACVDPRLRRDGAKLGLDVNDLVRLGSVALGETLDAATRTKNPEGALSSRLLAAADSWERELGAERSDTAVAQGVAKLRENIAFLAGKAEERAAAARARRSETLDAAARRVHGTIHPGGEPQDRVQNLLLQWHRSGGDAWVDQVLDGLELRTIQTQPIT